MKELNRFSQEAGLYNRPVSDTERRILAAAETIFGELGMDGATTAAIARKADVTERTLFKYFPTKSDLHRRLLYSIVFEIAAPVELASVRKQIESSDLEFGIWLGNILLDRLAAAERNRNRLAILASALLHDGKFRKVFGDVWLESIHKSSIQAIKLFQKRKELRSDVDPSILTRMVASLSLSQVMLRILFPESQPSTELEVSQYVSILTNGVL